MFSRAYSARNATTDVKEPAPATKEMQLEQ